MYLLVGLGNPEREYKHTRHNVGFEVINKLAYDHKIDINRAKFRAHFGEGRIGTVKVMLAKPQTYMNLSGESVRDIMAYYKIEPSQLIVIYDDTNLALGKLRLRENGSAGGHNGMKNIIYQLDTDQFVRVRVGIGEKPDGRMDLADHVLGRFSDAEMKTVIEGITDATDAIEMIIAGDLQKAMNKYNSRGKTGTKGE